MYFQKIKLYMLEYIFFILKKIICLNKKEKIKFDQI